MYKIDVHMATSHNIIQVVLKAISNKQLFSKHTFRVTGLSKTFILLSQVGIQTVES